MSYNVRVFSPEEWQLVAEDAHKSVFGQERPNSLNKHHFIVAGYTGDKLGGYMTCLEMDSETCYIQYGGAFPPFQGTVHVVPGYHAMLTYLHEHYVRLTTKIENKNVSMLKMAMAMGFLITGCTSFENKLYLDLTRG